MNEYIDYTNEWYDCLNDVFENRLPFALFSVYLEAILDTDYD